MRGERTAVAVVVVAAAAVAAFVVLDRYEGSARFADLPGDADVRLVGRFTPRQVDRIAALPQAAAVECGTTLYGVTAVTSRGVLSGATVLTAAARPGLRWSQVRSGTYPATDAQLLIDERTAAAHDVRPGERVTLLLGPAVVNATVVGIAARPSDHAIGTRDAVFLLPSGAVAALSGGASCDSVTVELRRRRDASTFSRAAEDLLDPPPAVIYDESLKGHV
ncbi:hypothetical protein Daura_47200 [Dactylosporangium aurantiacum]|uniref:Uncharacterized protein n=1 Tax=Dactylosporangium aurantiacum TaxID=35754 RepID=A0A9Q9IEN4_9ACTN|nr:ABC transporter permease [Dactylosporangium aurantiacum]MDG6105472.1 ABC transporter permease [Dactylosporangium aurantiacum]UWZ53991.1 hypothetical protein Daura_47200 [Dactylosporangium aurantiacum]